MSQIGRMPISLPDGVEVLKKDDNLIVKGKLGTLDFKFNNNLSIDISDNTVLVSRSSDEKKYRELHGLTRSLINNMIVGVSVGYEKKMTLVGTGYTAASKDNYLLLNVGFSHPVYVQCPDNVIVKTPQPTEVTISGIDKQLVGQFAARIRQIRKPEPYKGKGIRYSNEVVRKKAGKTVGAK